MQFKLNNTNFYLFLCLPLFLILSGCGILGSYTYSSFKKTAIVLDADTDKPIADAIVMTYWNGNFALLQSYSKCYHVETARTDANGVYKMPSWSVKQESDLPPITNKHSYTQAFKAGYISLPAGRKANGQNAEWGGDGNIYLMKFTGTKDEYFEYFRIISRQGNNCGKDDAKNMYKLNFAVLTEMQKIAETPQQKSIVEMNKLRLFYDKVNPNKPTKDDARGITINIDPKDNYTEEELLK